MGIDFMRFYVAAKSGQDPNKLFRDGKKPIAKESKEKKLKEKKLKEKKPKINSDENLSKKRLLSAAPAKVGRKKLLGS